MAYCLKNKCFDIVSQKKQQTENSTLSQKTCLYFINTFSLNNNQQGSIALKKSEKEGQNKHIK